MSFKEIKDFIKKIFTNVSSSIVDQYHILFKSAAVNHLRIQSALKNPDGTYQMTLKFGSYTELKRYQRKMRRLTISLSTAVAMVMVAFVVSPYVFNPSRSSASTFQWIQSSWGGSINSNAATKIGENDYASKDANIVAAAEGVSLNLPAPASTGDSAYAGSTGFYSSDANGTYNSSGSSLTLKKLQGKSCTNIAECKTGTCNSGTCCTDPCCGLTSISRTDNGTTFTYGLINAPDGKCWLDRNLGAIQEATVRDDSASYGWLFEWGRGVDGHQIRTSGITTTLSSTGVPGHGDFIRGVGSPYDWLSPQNNGLWQGVNGINNPCPAGFRIPTQTEWGNIATALSITNTTNAFTSVLKIPTAGQRAGTGELYEEGLAGSSALWGSDVSGSSAFNMSLHASIKYLTFGTRATGKSVRCIKN